jgi:aldose sugar dehydrogenase
MTMPYPLSLIVSAFITIIMANALANPTVLFYSAYAQEDDKGQQDSEKTSLPTLRDDTLKVELVADGLHHPTSMDFIDRDGNMIILQKSEGKALLVSTNGNSSENNNSSPKVVVAVKVNSTSERGLLGLALVPREVGKNNTTYVFLYFTESSDNNSTIRNRVYRYEWDSQEKILTRPALILDLPAKPGPNHDGGKLIFAKDEEEGNASVVQDQYHLYSVIGDLNRNGILQNFKNASDDSLDGTSVVFRLTLDGSAPDDNPFSKNTDFSTSSASGDNGTLLGKYFAYGIRNSFGLAVDPVTKTLWMTENGPNKYDEINVVKPGFNSGWQRVLGPIEKNDGKTTDDLVQIQGSQYADPVFSWLAPVGVTDIEFLNSTKLGAKYANNIFVGDIENGNLYFFTVNKDRTGIAFDDNGAGTGDDNQSRGLVDKIADNSDEVSAITFGTGFKGGITDIETGPDGYLYVLSYDGKLYRIVPNSQ